MIFFDDDISDSEDDVCITHIEPKIQPEKNYVNILPKEILNYFYEFNNMKASLSYQLQKRNIKGTRILKKHSLERKLCKYCCGEHSTKACPHISEASINEKNSKRKCYRCGKCDHLPTECPEYYFIEGKEINCYNCGNRHLSRECKKLPFETILQDLKYKRNALYSK